MTDAIPDAVPPEPATGFYTSAPPQLGLDIEHTVAGGFGGLFGCGTSMICLVLALGLSVALNAYLLKSFFSLYRDGIATIAALKEKIDD